MALSSTAIMNVIKNSPSKIKDFLGSEEGQSILQTSSDYFGNRQNANAEKAAAQAYQSYLDGIISNMQNQLEGRADKYDDKLQDMFSQAEPDFIKETSTQLPELTQLVNDISNESAEAQRQNRRQIQTELAQQGVRGGQAAILGNRATGELNRDLQRDINKSVYDEALNRQNQRMNYYGQKALTPWNSMSGAYGNSMVGANNALSQAQGNVYKNAYDNAMNNYMKSYSNKGSKFGNIANGALSGASAGSAFGPWGAAIGGVAGGVMGAMKK